MKHSVNATIDLTCHFFDRLMRRRAAKAATTARQFMPGGHSEWVPPLPIPNRTVKPLSADDSTDTRAKVGHRQAPHQGPQHMLGAFALSCPSSRVYDRLHRVRFRANINLTSSVFFVAHDCQNQIYVFEYRSIVHRRTVGHAKPTSSWQLPQNLTGISAL